jgi:hypothetical protein
MMAQRSVRYFARGMLSAGDPLILGCVVQVRHWEQIGSHPWRMWKLIPVQVDDLPTGLDGDKKDDPPPKYLAEPR